ncbi:MAG TPA: hypothetical protein VE912_20055, partial [Bacteroidales bacterium]|nr:hypothetical protein [Bacteroidales bacterium]
MKRKELSFMNVKEADLLSRDEMRNIMAGSGNICNVCTNCGPSYNVGEVCCYGVTSCDTLGSSAVVCDNHITSC